MWQQDPPLIVKDAPVHSSQHAVRVEDENHDLRARLSSVEETLKQIQDCQCCQQFVSLVGIPAGIQFGIEFLIP
jgi:hypothetical protein